MDLGTGDTSGASGVVVATTATGASGSNASASSGISSLFTTEAIAATAKKLKKPLEYIYDYDKEVSKPCRYTAGGLNYEHGEIELPAAGTDPTTACVAMFGTHKEVLSITIEEHLANVSKTGTVALKTNVRRGKVDSKKAVKMSGPAVLFHGTAGPDNQEVS